LDYSQAKHVILTHATGIRNADDWIEFEETGYIGCLRPYTGIRHENFHDIVNALLVVGEQIHGNPEVERDLVHAIWSLTYTARIYGIDPNGMLKRNNLITEPDAALIEEWNDIIESITLGLLQGLPPYLVIERYASYISRHEHCGNLEFTIPYFKQLLEDPDCNDPSEILPAILKLGPYRQKLYTSLLELGSRSFPDYCREECEALLKLAVEACADTNAE